MTNRDTYDIEEGKKLDDQEAINNKRHFIHIGLLTLHSASFDELMETAVWHASLQVEFDKELFTESALI